MNQNHTKQHDICQLQGVIRSSVPADEKGISMIVRIKRSIKRRLSVKREKKIKDIIGSMLDFFDRIRGRTTMQVAAPETQRPQRLNAGDLVRVRSLEEIQATLDRWRSLKGCGFLEEMASYCGTTQRVLKRVERFIDERDYRQKKASGIVLLEGVLCSGTSTTGRCDRSCFFFWREEWLEKLDESEAP